MTHFISLKAHNTLGLEHGCRDLVIATTAEELISCCREIYQTNEPMLILGGGSNIVFCDDFVGSVVVVDTKGVEVSEVEEHYLLTVAAGENWHDFVSFCLSQGIDGLENLALIPGTVGAAPIQNIGAYGLEFSDVCAWVEYVDLPSGEVVRLSQAECFFGYRDSIFKHQLSGKALITQVGFKIAKTWQPKLNYGPLKALNQQSVTAKAVFDCVCATRSSKLPDPVTTGNVGSFFKNPIIENEHYLQLVHQFPGIVGYAHGTKKTKVAAGWLIDMAGLKGFQVGGAAVHEDQALVLINKSNASSEDVLALARHIVSCIAKLFNIHLEVEPRILGKTGLRSL